MSLLDLPHADIIQKQKKFEPFNKRKHIIELAQP